MKATKIRLHVRNAEDHETLRKVLGTVRWTYNQCVAHLRQNPKVRPTKKLLRSLFVNNDSETVCGNPWLLETGYDIRDDSIKDLLTALKGNKTKITNKTQTHFQMRFRCKKKQRSETFYLRSRWIVRKENTIVVSLPKVKKPLTFWVGKNAWKGPILMDCKFQRTWTGEYYLCVPYAYGVDNQDPVPQQNLRVCSLDPGVRTFQTVFDATEGCAYEVAPGDMRRIVRLCVCLDKLCSKRDKATQAKKRYSYKRAARRLISKIQNLVNEVHRQLAKHLASHYDLILIPKFEVSQMIKKANRKLASKTVRQMTGWAHYRFRQRLLFKCRQYRTKVAVVDEAWTSKTCSECGSLHHKLGSNKVFSCPQCKATMDRDVNGAKNIFLKNHEALGLCLTLGPTPFLLETGGCTETLGSLLNSEIDRNREILVDFEV